MTYPLVTVCERDWYNKKNDTKSSNKNSKNNHINDIEDVAQEVRIAFLEAGSYYKRQVYIEDSFNILKEHVTDLSVLEQVSELEYLWRNRTQHGASRQKFGSIQEKKLFFFH